MQVARATQVLVLVIHKVAATLKLLQSVPVGHGAFKSSAPTFSFFHDLRLDADEVARCWVLCDVSGVVQKVWGADRAAVGPSGLWDRGVFLGVEHLAAHFFHTMPGSLTFFFDQKWWLSEVGLLYGFIMAGEWNRHVYRFLQQPPPPPKTLTLPFNR